MKNNITSKVQWDAQSVLWSYFVQWVHVLLAITRGSWLGVSRRWRARTGAHHAVRGTWWWPGTGTHHCTRWGTRTRWRTWARGASHWRVWRRHRPGSPASSPSRQNLIKEWTFDKKKNIYIWLSEFILGIRRSTCASVLSSVYLAGGWIPIKERTSPPAALHRITRKCISSCWVSRRAHREQKWRTYRRWCTQAYRENILVQLKEKNK